MNKKYTIIRRILIYIIIFNLANTSFNYLNNVANAKTIMVESSSTPDIKRSSTIIQKTTTSNTFSMQTLSTTATTETLGPNLIQNPTLDLANATGLPTGWNRGGYGSNTRVFNYPVPGNSDTKAIKVTVSNYIGGDAKWYFNDINVKPGEIYQYTDYSLSNVSSIITIRYKMSNGTFIYKDMAVVNPSNIYQKTTFRITVPSGVVSLTSFHLIKSNGSLSTDDYSLNLVTTPTQTSNMIDNGNFETVGLDGLPINWLKGGWGMNSKVFTYPVTGQTNSSAAKIEITSFTSGDAKWYFKPVSITPGIYTYSDQTISNVPSTITAQFFNIDGSVTFQDLVKMSPSSTLKSTLIDFAVGTGVSKITIFHLIQSQGNLIIDNASLVKKSDPVGIFKTGAVSLRFDDGWLSEYENAIPKMNTANIKGTFYIVSNQKADDGFPAFMSIAQIKEIYSMGHEIGAHTKTHPYLSQLSTINQQNEIVGSRNDLLALGVGPINSFAYPYGDYNTTTLSIVKDAGFTSALSTIDGFATQLSDKYQIERVAITSNTTLSQIKQWVDNAQIQKKWLILNFHEVNNNGQLYSITPELFGQIIDYIVSKNIPVVTISEGAKSI